MRLTLTRKLDLTEALAFRIADRLGEAVHQYDQGPPTVWEQPAYAPNLYAFLLRECGTPVGLADASGPPHAVNAGWWIDQAFRGQRLGNDLVDCLAAHLKQNGFTGVGKIDVITHIGAYDAASARLRTRFRRHFVT